MATPKRPPPWDFSCPDWEDRIKEGRPLMPDLPLNKELAAVGIEMFNAMRLPDVVGKPFLRDAAGQWFRDIVGTVTGSMIGNRRMVPEIFVLAPKKSSKTSYSAALMLTMLVLNEKPRSELLFIAPSKIIAQIAYDQAVGMINEDPEFLFRRFHTIDHKKEIKDLITGSRLVIKAFDAKVITGVKPVAVLVDELHEIAKSPKAVGILSQIRGGLLPHPESLLIFITTQSDDEPRGVFKDELAAARAIRSGEKTGKMLPILYEFPLEIAKNREKWSNPAIWGMVNPNLGRPVQLEDLIADFKAESEKGDYATQVWCSQHLNIQIGLGYMTNQWAGAAYWEQNAAPLLTLDDLIEQCEVAVVGIDGGGMDDLLGLVVLGRKKGTAEDPSARDWLCWSRAWVHEKVLRDRKDIATLLRDLHEEGSLKIIPDSTDQDVKDVAEIVMKLEKAKLLPQKAAIGVDRVGISDINDELELNGFDCSIAGQRVISINQGWQLSSVIKTVARKLSQGAVTHDGTKLMRWCVGNCKIEPRGNAESIVKASYSAKIDPVMALLDAASLMALNPDAARRGSYLDKAERVLVLG